MNRELTLERHLLSRCYSSQGEIQTLVDVRYFNNEAVDPHLVLLPTSAVEGVKPSSKNGHGNFMKNTDIKPTQTRKANARRAMKVYIKQTLAAQKKAIRKVQEYERKRVTHDVDQLTLKYNIPRYDVYLQLHELWKKYMHDLVFGDQKNPNLNMILPKLSTADYNGCLLKVIEAKDRNLIGFSGIVMYDSQHSFMLVSPQMKESKHVISPAQRVGGLKVISKRGTMFAFELQVSERESVGFTILGSRFELRAVDRASKKFKSHSVEDIYQ